MRFDIEQTAITAITARLDGLETMVDRLHERLLRVDRISAIVCLLIFKRYLSLFWAPFPV
jgi:hypothetical protein